MEIFLELALYFWWGLCIVIALVICIVSISILCTPGFFWVRVSIGVVVALIVIGAIAHWKFIEEPSLTTDLPTISQEVEEETIILNTTTYIDLLDLPADYTDAPRH